MIPLVSNPAYSFHFDHHHRFPMEKFKLLYEYLEHKKIVREHNVFRPGRAKHTILNQAHCPDYLHRFIHNQQSKLEIRRMGLPWSEGLVRRTLISPNGTLLAASLALKYGVACHLAGGTHHAHYDFASGFCILNDLAITAKTLIAKEHVNKIVIFDCDVHQGDGTANMLADTPEAFTCSIHCEKNFPARKATSDLDIELEKGLCDQDYLTIVEKTLHQLIQEQRPQLILYDAGVDIFTDDPLGLLNISEDGIRARDNLVLSLCKRHNIPVATVIGGGYDDNRHALAKRHAMVVEEAFGLFS